MESDRLLLLCLGFEVVCLIVRNRGSVSFGFELIVEGKDRGCGEYSYGKEDLNDRVVSS